MKQPSFLPFSNCSSTRIIGRGMRRSTHISMGPQRSTSFRQAALTDQIIQAKAMMAVHGSMVMLMALLASLLMVASPARGSFPAGAHLLGLTAPQQAALAEHLVAAASGAAAQLPHDRRLLQGKGKAAAGRAPAPAPAPESEIAILIDLPPGVEPEDLSPTEEQQLVRTALGIAAAIETISNLVVPEPAPAMEPQPV